METVSNLEFLEAANVNGVDRDPGEVTTASTPSRAKTSKTKAPTADLIFDSERESKCGAECISCKYNKT